MSTIAGDRMGGVATDREKAIRVLELLETRMQWSTARALILPTSLHVSRGWQETLASVREDNYSDSIWTSASATLTNTALWHTYVGNKRVSIFDLREQNDTTRKNAKGWAIDKAVGDLWPVCQSNKIDIHSVPTSQLDLAPYKGREPSLIAAALQDGKLYLQFFSTRSYTKREPLEVSKMGEVPAAFFREYEEIIGVRTRYVPCFDTVVLDTLNDLVEFRLDFQPGMTEDKTAPAFVRVAQALGAITSRFTGHSVVGAGLINFYPVVSPLYLDGSCGRVTALGFVATSHDTSSNNQGRIHRRRTQDFRNDKFHLGGRQNVSRVEPYAIGVTWDQTAPRPDLYLELRGSARAIYTGTSAISEAEFQGCLDGKDYDFLSNQVLSRLKRRPQ